MASTPPPYTAVFTSTDCTIHGRCQHHDISSVASQGPIAMRKNFPESAKFLPHSSQELEQAVSSACSLEAAQKLRPVQKGRSWAPAALLAKPLRSQVHGLRKGSVVWAYLNKQHNLWLHSRGMVLEDEYQRLEP
jgi:hypothetical protein